jgi:hypothetical protein
MGLSKFLRIQDGRKPMSLEILFLSRPQARSRKKASPGTRMEGYVDIAWPLTNQYRNEKGWNMEDLLIVNIS